ARLKAAATKYKMRTLDELAENFGALAATPSPRGAAIGITNPDVARYARALEFGSVAGEKPWPQPGPRTVAVVDAETGARVVVSAQAPHGFIRSNLAQFIEQLVREMASPANWLDADNVAAHLDDAVRRGAAAALDTLQQSAPRDSGRLAESLTLLEP
ncbi:MAG TPA: hypothetical protein VNL38_01740, partial [Candidatus Nitrosotenuis sp.]|nr:hypothetical protein [Candidatus Nitrosotenuis sp.]